MKVVNATSARANFFGLMDQVADEHEEILITGKRTNAVLVSEEDWRSIQETLYLTSVPGLVRDVQEAAATTDDEWMPHDEFLEILNRDED